MVFDINNKGSNPFISVEKIKSELRFEIDREFRDHKIIIPFPQRTVWQGPERVKQFGDGIVGAGENIASEDEDTTSGAL